MLALHLTPFLATGEHRQARGTHINVRKLVKVSCHGTFKINLQKGVIFGCFSYSAQIRMNEKGKKDRLL